MKSVVNKFFCLFSFVFDLIAASLRMNRSGYLIFIKLWLEETDTYRLSKGDCMPGRIKFTGIKIDPEDDNTIGVLVGHQAKIPCRIDIKIPGGFNIGGFMSNES